MSWHCLPELVEEYSEGNYLDGEPCAPLKSTPSAGRCYSGGNWMDAYIGSLSGMTSELSMESRGKEKLMSFQPDSHVKIYAKMVQELELMEKDRIYGVRQYGYLAKFDQNTYSWKTRQTLLFEDCEASLLSFPKWGYVFNGELYPLRPLVPDISVPDCFWWPSVTTPTGGGNWGGSHEASKARRLGVAVHHSINPNLYEWLMGWPLDYTDLKPLETDKFQRWLDSHGVS